MEITRRQAEVCAALADYHRVLLMYAVADVPQNVTQLVKRVGISQPAVSRHLRIMRECGVVTSKRQGKSIYYLLADRRILQAMDLLRASLTEQMQRGGQAATEADVHPPV